MKLSDAGIVQKSVMKAMSGLAAICNVSHLTSTLNAWLCSSTDLGTLCLDMLGHLGSHYLMNFTNPTRVLVCVLENCGLDYNNIVRI